MAVSITYTGNVAKLTQAAQQANQILSSQNLLTIICLRTTPFDDSRPANLQPHRVADEFGSSNLALTLREYKTSSSIGGKFNTGYPTSIWANLNAVPLRSACSLAAMLVHECTHALSYNVQGIDFSHDNQDPGYNQNTAPYWIQNKIKQQYCAALVKEGKEDEEFIMVLLEEQEEGLV